MPAKGKSELLVECLLTFGNVYNLEIKEDKMKKVHGQHEIVRTTEEAVSPQEGKHF